MVAQNMVMALAITEMSNQLSMSYDSTRYGDYYYRSSKLCGRLYILRKSAPIYFSPLCLNTPLKMNMTGNLLLSLR